MIRPRLAALAALTLSLVTLPVLTAPTTSVAAANPLCSLLPILCPPEPDVTPPDTEITAQTPATNADGWVTSRSVAFSFRFTYPEGQAPQPTEDNPNPQTNFQCRTQTPSQNSPTAWAACTSPVQLNNLADTDRADASKVHRFEVRAVHPNNRNADASPAAVSFRLDATPPQTELLSAPVLEGPGQAYLLDNKAAFQFFGLGGGITGYVCALNARVFSCPETRHTATGLGAGRYRFAVSARDQAGNVDPSPATFDFVVPFNRVGTKKQIRRMWTRVAAPNHFNDDYVITRTKGAFLTRRISGVREIAIVAPRGPGQGKIRVDLGKTRLKVIKFQAQRFQHKQMFRVVVPGGRPVSGLLRITVISPNGKPVYIDGLALR